MSTPTPQPDPTQDNQDVAKTFLQVAGDKLPAPMLLVLLVLFLIIVWGVAIEQNLLYLLLLLLPLGIGGWIWSEWQKDKAAQREHQRQIRLDEQQYELERERLRQNQKEAGADEPASDPSSAEPEDSLEHRYLTRVAARCEMLPMEAVDKTATRPDAARVALNRVFTQVDVPERLDPEETEHLAARRQTAEESRQPAIAAIGEREVSYLVLLGKPGSGKSTLVDYITLCLAGEELRRPGDPTLDDLEGQGWALRWQLPVRVILREYAEHGLGRRQSLWDYIVADLAKPDEEGRDLAAYAAHLEAHLRRRGGLLLLDGLDEVPDAHRWRERLREEIRTFAADFDRVRILVTGRPYAYDRTEWQLPGFERTELLDFRQEQMFAYVDKRYQLMAGGETGMAQTQAAEFADELKRQIKERKALRELAARPLLLALITSLHHWRGGRTLPQDREKLYDESVDLLIDLWQRRKRLPQVDPNDESARELTHLLGVGPVELRDALSKVAFEVHHDQPKPQGTANVPADKLAGTLHGVLDPDSRVTSHQIIAYVQNRAGLLEERDGTVAGSEVYAFVHRTFQEYLAGCHLLTQDDFADQAAGLARRDPERWREALLLAARRDKSPTSAWDLVDALCRPEETPQPGETVPDVAWWGAFLAGQVLLERELWRDPPARREALVARVRGWLAALLDAGALPPRDRALAGQTLALLGDPRPGVGVVVRDGLALPDIAWGKWLPAGTYKIGGDKDAYQSFDSKEVPIPHDFRLSRYPITYAQFHCFVEAEDFSDERWWAGMPEMWKDVLNQEYNLRKILAQGFPYANHPREMVSWYQALAFCRWLSDKLGQTISLPHEYEWEAAARHPDGRFYPWGDDFDVARTNIDESGIGQTTAVGMYPSGRQDDLDLYDLSGNVWEWCRNEYGKPDDDMDPDRIDVASPRRVLRGGSFFNPRHHARAATRHDDNLVYRLFGFRMVGVRLSPSHPDH